MDIDNKRARSFELGKPEKTVSKQDRLSDINAIKIEKLSFKITLISIIFPIIICLLIVFVYVKLEKSIFSGLSSGSEGMQQMEKAFKKETDYIGVMYRKLKEEVDENEKNFASFKNSFLKLSSSKVNNEKTIISKLNNLEKNYSVIDMKISELERVMTSKSDKKELEKTYLAFQNNINLFKSSFDALKEELDNFKKKSEEEKDINDFNIKKANDTLSDLQNRLNQFEDNKDKKGSEYLNVINQQLLLQKRVDNLYKIVKETQK